MTAIGYCRTDRADWGPRLSEAPGSPIVSSFDRTENPRLAQALSDPLLPSVAAGEPGAAERCLDRYGGLVWSLARKYFAERSDAEDAVQEAFVSLWKNAGRFNPDIASETTFVAMIARRRIIDLVRRTRAAGPKNEPSGESIDPAEVADVTTTPGVELVEEVQRIRAQMRSLREEEQRVIDLAVCQGFSQSQIAEVTGWPLGTVKSHARRGMARLRDLLGVQPPTPDSRKEAAR